MEKIAKQIADIAGWALLEEVHTTPKPGLVDCYSNGAHKDMTVRTFEDSAKALHPYFLMMAEIGWEYYEKPQEIFLKIREVGKLAEGAMYRATNGVNTHKGLIFSIGILSAAAAAVFHQTKEISREDIFVKEMEMVQNILLQELAASGMKKKDLTNGEKVYKKYGSFGVRGEALYGYAAVRNLSLPVFDEGVENHMDFETVKLQALVTLMSQVEDSNILYRSDMDRLKQVQKMSRDFLNAGGMYQQSGMETMMEWDRQFIDWNISPGGSADLLAITLFIYRVTGGIR